MPRTTVCRRHYGFTWGQHFQEGIDDEKNAYYFWGEKYCSGHMKWMIEKVRFYFRLPRCLDQLT